MSYAPVPKFQIQQAPTLPVKASRLHEDLRSSKSHKDLPFLLQVSDLTEIYALPPSVSVLL